MVSGSKIGIEGEQRDVLAAAQSGRAANSLHLKLAASRTSNRLLLRSCSAGAVAAESRIPVIG